MGTMELGVGYSPSCLRAKINNRYMPASCLPFPSDRYSCAHGRKEVQFLSCAHEQLWEQELLSQTTFKVLQDANLISLEQSSE